MPTRLPDPGDGAREGRVEEPRRPPDRDRPPGPGRPGDADPPPIAADQPAMADAPDRHAPGVPFDRDEQLQAVVDRYERLLAAQRANYERRLATARDDADSHDPSGVVARLRRWLRRLR